MVKITFVEPSGDAKDVEAEEGLTIMEAAVKNNIIGIDADCGGACACATCHVYVDREWTARVGKPEAMEESMLDFAQEVQENSRLSCQIQVTPALEGLILRIPEYQG